MTKEEFKRAKEKIKGENKMTYRHGDVQLTEIEKLPDGVKSLEDRKYLALGEATGHAHRVKSGELFEDAGGVLFLLVKNTDELTHEEHAGKILEPAVYRVGIKRQYDAAGGWSKVVD